MTYHNFRRLTMNVKAYHRLNFDKVCKKLNYKYSTVICTLEFLNNSKSILSHVIKTKVCSILDKNETYA